VNAPLCAASRKPPLPAWLATHLLHHHVITCAPHQPRVHQKNLPQHRRQYAAACLPGVQILSIRITTNEIGAMSCITLSPQPYSIAMHLQSCKAAKNGRLTACAPRARHPSPHMVLPDGRQAINQNLWRCFTHTTSRQA
jgi:hypothetical protein